MTANTAQSLVAIPTLKNAFWSPTAAEMQKLLADIAEKYKIKCTPKAVDKPTGYTESIDRWSAWVNVDGEITEVTYDGTSYETYTSFFGEESEQYATGQVYRWNSLEEAISDKIHGKLVPVDELKAAAHARASKLRAVYDAAVAEQNEYAQGADAAAQNITNAATAGILGVLNAMDAELSENDGARRHYDAVREAAQGAIVAAIAMQHPALCESIQQMQIDHRRWRDISWLMLSLHVLPDWARMRLEDGKKEFYAKPSKAVVRRVVQEFWPSHAGEIMEFYTPENPYGGLSRFSNNALRKAGYPLGFGVNQQYRQEDLMREEARIDSRGFYLPEPKAATKEAAKTLPTDERIKQIRNNVDLLIEAISTYAATHQDSNPMCAAAILLLRKGVTLSKMPLPQKNYALTAAEWVATNKHR